METKKTTNFAFDTRVIELAQKRFRSTADARKALQQAIEGIADTQLRDIRSIQILLMA